MENECTWSKEACEAFQRWLDNVPKNAVIVHEGGHYPDWCNSVEMCCGTGAIACYFPYEYKQKDVPIYISILPILIIVLSILSFIFLVKVVRNVQ